MDHFRMEVEGLKELQRAIRQAGDTGLRNELRDTNKSVARMVVDAARPNVPFRTGKLRASLKASATPTAAFGKAGTPARVPYAAAIHWGSPARDITGRPFLWDAAEQTINRAVREYETAIQDVFDKAVSRA